MLHQTKKHQLKQDDKIHMTLVLPMNTGETHYVDTFGEVMRVIQSKDSQPDRVSVEFYKLHEKDRQVIIRYCFDQQMLMRMKALQ